MDGSHIDAVTRSLGRSRRGVLAGLLGVVGLLGPPATTAKKKHGKGKKKRKTTPVPPPIAPPVVPPPPPVSCPVGQKPCAGICIPRSNCCTNPDCPSTAPQCFLGECVCPTQCCTEAACPADRICQNGNCACPPETPACGAICCTSPDGFPASQIACVSAGGGTPSCVCTYRTADVCAPGCPVQRTFPTDCTARGAEELRAFCAELGC